MEILKNCWHACTEGLKTRLMFRDFKDFIQGMNSVAICSHGRKVAVLAFCLMGNHVHFVLNGEEKDVKAFMSAYLKRVGMWTEDKYKERSPFRRIGTLLKPILSREHLAIVISYVHRNPLAAGICAPTNYEWSTANVFFGQRRMRGQWRKIGEFTSRQLKGTLRTRRVDLPDGWLVNEEGLILPQCYVHVRFVEKLYGRSAVNYMYSLNTNKDAEVEALMLSGRRAFPDDVMRQKIPALCKEYFGKDNFDSLSINDKYAFVSILHRQYACGAKQVSRLTGMEPDIVSHLLGKSC